MKSTNSIQNSAQGGPKTPSKQVNCRNAFKAGLYAQSISSFPEEEQQRYHQLIRFYTADYTPSNAVEVDLIHHMALNRLRYFRFQRYEAQAQSLRQLLDMNKLLSGLERAFFKLVKTLEDRRKNNPKINVKIIVQWIDPMTGKPWRPSKKLREEILKKNSAKKPEPQPEPAPGIPPDRPTPPTQPPAVIQPRETCPSPAVPSRP
jgi:hypothetical protein